MKNETNLWGEWWGSTDPRQLFSKLPAISISQMSFIAGVKAAQQSVQLAASGAGWRECFGKYLIRLGFRLAKIGDN